MENPQDLSTEYLYLIEFSPLKELFSVAFPQSFPQKITGFPQNLRLDRQSRPNWGHKNLQIWPQLGQERNWGKSKVLPWPVENAKK